LRGRGRFVLAVFAAAAVLAMLGAVQAGASHSVGSWLSTGPNGGNGAFPATAAGFSDDGTRVFIETEEQLVAADTDASMDIYERTGTATTLISTGPSGGNGAFHADFFDASKDGSRVFFETNEALVADDADSARDVYERANGVTTRISTGPTGGNAAQDSFFGGISQDGLHVFFVTYEPLVAADNDSSRRDVYERFGGSTSLVSIGPQGGTALLEAAYAGSTPEGSTVWFTTQEKLVAGDTDSATDVYEREGGVTTQISTGANGNFPAFFEGASLTGNRVFYSTNESMLAGDTDAFRDIYERSNGNTTQISVGPNGGSGPYQASFGGVSLDGTRVFFQTREPLVSGDTDGACPDTSEPPLFILLCNDVYERTGSTTTWISSGGNGAHEASFAAISQEGGRVFFTTSESLVAADGDSGARDVYERFAGNLALISQGPAGGTGNHAAEFVGASADGTRVFFQTYEKLVSGDVDNTWLDQYERNAGQTTLISTGPNSVGADAISIWRGSSLDGTRVFFQTDEILISGDTDASEDVYSREAPTAGFPRPKGATPTALSLVPAYNECTSPNRTHGPSLANPSCNPPQQASSILTVGSPDANGFPAASNSRIKYRVIAGSPGLPEDSDLDLLVNVNDVRCRVTNTACPGGSGSDFTGKLLLRTNIRMTDKFNGSPTVDAATVEDFDLDVPVQCAATGSTSLGGTCDLATTLNAVIPGAVLDTKRAIVELGRAEARDPGPNGTGYGAGCPGSCGDGDEGTFMRQGIFVP
jgi:hypothetical protein